MTVDQMMPLPGSERDLNLMTERHMRQVSDLPAFQKRTCVRCGRQTTFELQDPAGWYSCSGCGRYA